MVLNFVQVSSDSAKLILRDDMKTPEYIHIQVRVGNGEWQTVVVANPRSYWSIEAFDLSPYVGFDTTKQDNYEIHYANLVPAIHSTQGDVKNNPHTKRQRLRELVPGQQIKLEFTLPNNTKQARTYTTQKDTTTQLHHNTEIIQAHNLGGIRMYCAVIILQR